jgi:MoaA/NifB/PqqE/SkfB family radical SAM enzyme
MEKLISLNSMHKLISNNFNKNWKFSELLTDAEIRQRWEKVRQFFFLRESTYDMTSRCNIRCDGCYYYEGEKQYAKDNLDPLAWRLLIKEEKKRGITFVVLAGAEPSLVPQLLEVCYEEIPLGCIATNGVKRIPKSIGYKIHVSVWGNDTTSQRVRNVKNLLVRQLDNYKNDERVVFVYTFTRENIEEANGVIKTIAEQGCKVTFNVFSSPVGYNGSLRHTQISLENTRKAMTDLLSLYPDQVVFSPYNIVAHTGNYGLHALYGCSYPRAMPSTHIGLGRSFRQYRADLSWDRSVACCVPDTDCADCRHYAAGSAIVSARLYRHATDPITFKSWLDYVDTYLAVWVAGYEKSAALCREMVTPPRADELK